MINIFLVSLIFQGWKEQVGKVYRRCLQVHPEKADLRVSSGRYELEQALADISSEKTGKGSTDSGLRVENARTVFMEAIRFHPKVRCFYVYHRNSFWAEVRRECPQTLSFSFKLWFFLRHFSFHFLFRFSIFLKGFGMIRFVQYLYVVKIA